MSNCHFNFIYRIFNKFAQNILVKSKIGDIKVDPHPIIDNITYYLTYHRTDEELPYWIPLNSYFQKRKNPLYLSEIPSDRPDVIEYFL